jgi:arylsulfatase A-like enzyme
VGGKMDLTEGGIRVPWIAHWPAVIAPGGVSAQQCMTMDWSTTMLDAAGAAADPAYPLDGVSLLPVLRDAQPCRSRGRCTGA